VQLKTGKEFGDVRTESPANASMSNSYQKQMKFKEAIEYYLKSIALSEKHCKKVTLKN
jgi:hypothetical protein